MCLTLLGCANPSPPQKKSEQAALANQVLQECAQTLSNRYFMSQSGEGGDMMFEIKGLFLAFYIYYQLTKEEAREILIDCVHELITTVYTNSDIQKYLLPGGFTEKSVEIQIYIYPNLKQNLHPDLGVCSYNYGKLAFSTNDPDKMSKYKIDETETYAEALSLLRNSSGVMVWTDEMVEAGLNFQKTLNSFSSNPSKENFESMLFSGVIDSFDKLELSPEEMQMLKAEFPSYIDTVDGSLEKAEKLLDTDFDEFSEKSLKLFVMIKKEINSKRKINLASFESQQ